MCNDPESHPADAAMICRGSEVQGGTPLLPLCHDGGYVGVSSRDYLPARLSNEVSKDAPWAYCLNRVLK